jgi:hypothetical protein
VAAGDREGTLRTYMDGMPPEWFEAMRTGPQWPLFERMAPTVEADAEALAWTQSAPRRQLWSSVTAPAVVLLGSDPFPFFVDAAESIVGALPAAERAVVPGGGHRWRPADLAACIAGYLPGRVNGVPDGGRSS